MVKCFGVCICKADWSGGEGAVGVWCGLGRVMYTHLIGIMFQGAVITHISHSI